MCRDLLIAFIAQYDQLARAADRSRSSALGWDRPIERAPSALIDVVHVHLRDGQGEARSIQRGIRASEYRDSVNFQTRWAVQAMDILQAINELKPTVVHFSGHGTNDELALKDDQGGPWAISKEAIVNAIAVSSRSVRIVFFNTCFSYNQAKGFVGKIDAAIGMNREVGDYAAQIFSTSYEL